MRVFIPGGHDIERAAFSGALADRLQIPYEPWKHLQRIGSELDRCSWVSEAPFLDQTGTWRVNYLAHRVIVLADNPHAFVYGNQKYRDFTVNRLERFVQKYDARTRGMGRIVHVSADMKQWVNSIQSLSAENSPS